MPDRLDRYTGLGVAIADNRGTCAHSGFCTDRIPTVFRTDKEPFVAPAGGRVDEILRAARDCPSGALSATTDDGDPVGRSDSPREPAIEVSKDGPYRVTGSIELLDRDGRSEARNDGASLEHYSLCRCGKSQNKPFCSGMHWYADFHDPPPPEQATLFQWAGGFPALLRLTRRFYEVHVPQDPLLSGLFSQMSPDHPQRVAAWLGQVFGGPPAYSDRYGEYDRMISQHLDKALTPEQRARWVLLLARSADDVGLPADAEFRAAFTAYLEWGSRIALENSQPGVHPPPHMPVPRWWWVCDAYPRSRPHATPDAVPEAPAPELPAPDQPLSYEAHIKPLFRQRDRDSMRFAFDLWSHEDVSTHADTILDTPASRNHALRRRMATRARRSVQTLDRRRHPGLGRKPRLPSNTPHRDEVRRLAMRTGSAQGGREHATGRSMRPALARRSNPASRRAAAPPVAVSLPISDTASHVAPISVMPAPTRRQGSSRTTARALLFARKGSRGHRLWTPAPCI